MSAERLTGQCLCGGVRYELTKPPHNAMYCHCTRCQRRTGTAASYNALLEPDSLAVTDGEELIQGWDPGDGGGIKEFCSACGAGLWSRHPQTGQFLAVRMGTLDSDPGVRASFRTFVANAAPWEPIPEDGLPRFPQRRTA